MNKVGSEKARKKLPELLDDAKNGKRTMITKHGEPYAVIVPIDQGISAPTGGVLGLLGTGEGLWGKSPEKFVRNLRAEWD